jgi:hypothetical protein
MKTKDLLAYEKESILERKKQAAHKLKNDRKNLLGIWADFSC